MRCQIQMLESRRSISVLIAIFLVVISFSASASFAGETKSHSSPGISQLIETRDGKTSCWGVVIQLHEMTLSSSFGDDDFTITEAKHNADLKKLTVWMIDNQKKQLTIKFKPGMGDFGSGNDVSVILEGSAFISNPTQRFLFTMPTDRL